MKMTKKYQEIVLMYHFNPINDCRLFENMETQYIYRHEDRRNKKKGMYQYIYLYTQEYCKLKKKQSNEVYKRIKLTKNCINNEQGVKKNKKGEYNICEGVTSIGYNCFNGCSSLTSVQLPSTLISIGDIAFWFTNISTITIPEGVTKFECRVPEFIKNMLKKKGIECPNSYQD